MFNNVKDYLENLKGSLNTLKNDVYVTHKEEWDAKKNYPAYGVTGPNKNISPMSGDSKLAQSAQLYHYQHQKQQIIAMENEMKSEDKKMSISESESEEENEEGDYTVYECPGLAPTGEMEVKNPLFQDDQTPATKPACDQNEESQKLPDLISFE